MEKIEKRGEGGNRGERWRGGEKKGRGGGGGRERKEMKG